MRLISDMGSTHHNSFENVLSHLFMAKAHGFWGIKGQICANSNGNIPFRLEWLPEAVKVANKVGIEFFCSVWDELAMETCFTAGCKTIKFAHSMRKADNLITRALGMFDRVIITDNLMDKPVLFHKGLIRLWTVVDPAGVTVYPVTAKLSHTPSLYKRYNGFSCHSIDVVGEMARAQKAGAEYFEAHFKTDDSLETPDERFASRYEVLDPAVDQPSMSFVRQDVPSPRTATEGVSDVPAAKIPTKKSKN